MDVLVPNEHNFDMSLTFLANNMNIEGFDMIYFQKLDMS